MGGNADGLAGIARDTARAVPHPTPDGGGPAWDRFAGWSRAPARAVLFAFLMLLAMAAIVPIEAGPSEVATQGFVENLAGAPAPDRERDPDLALYDVAVERIRAGENYYDFIVEEQRKADYPVRPGIAVRLPTLAYLNAALGLTGQTIAAILLLVAVLAAWWRRLGNEPGGRERRVLAMAFLFVGASLGLNRYFFQLHELWAGMLLALAFALHRPGRGDGGGRWGASLAIAALALAIREHALPFVLLMAAMAVWRRDWREGVAWSALAAVFLAGLAIHMHTIAAQTVPGDPRGQGWLYMRGLSGWLSNVVLSGNLRHLPHWIAGPAVILAMMGWAGWRSPAGLFGTLLFFGYGIAFMIAGRPDNFYWGMVVAPAMGIGLAFSLVSLRSLIRSAAPGRVLAV